MIRFLRLFFSYILWVIWWTNAIISIITLMLISFVIPKKMYNGPVRLVCRLLCWCVFIFPKAINRSGADTPYPVIYTANHVSFFDLFVSGAVLPGNPRGLELKSHFSKPVYGWFITRFGEIPIDPKSASSIKRSFENAADILKRGERSLLIMPEGTRTRDGMVKKFRSGAFYLSRKSSVPVVPVVYKNLYNINNSNSHIIKPGIVKAVLLPPVYPQNFDSDDQMAEYVKSLIEQELAKTDET